MSYQGNPCWYELGTSDLKGATGFYEKIIGWQIADSGMEGFNYLLARSGEEMVAGMMSNDMQEGPPPPNWLIYFAVDDCDAAAAQITAAGGRIYKAPADIPGTGRFAVAADPQGAAFGILQPDMSKMTPEQIAKAETTGAFDHKKSGHGCWNELMSPDPEAGYAFYSGLFGWTKGEAMDMGECPDGGSAGIYQLIQHNGQDIGAIQPHINSPVPAWLPYFGVDGSVAAKIEAIRSAGGQVHFGPQEVPGPAWIAIAQDPQGAAFAIAGPEE
ncbi:VOC family protein [Paracoccus xiamenensis]|uniref:VOC family protein n=1 Tax=Paracoccus xiamenensis TaxID=2714901 RepID=UPI00140904E7|nr:VOC family protein [Paracoccus xiamenensis]NHF73527.1 VOC family protein [Paracoccus xiamenensis]